MALQRVSELKFSIAKDQIDQIRSIPYYKGSQYVSLDIEETLIFFHKRYVQQLNDFQSVSDQTVIADIGAGFGWLSIAFAMSTKAKIIAIDPDKPRLEAAEKIAEILNVGDKIEWRVGMLGNLPLKDQESDVSYCVEVLEHVGRDPRTLSDLCRSTKSTIVLTTPNLWFPVIAHDTRLPFCHMLPIPVRKVYAKVFGRTDRENDNLFWSPISLKRNMKGFSRVSSWLHYYSYLNFQKTFPFYLPYGNGSHVSEIGQIKRIYYKIISKFKRSSHFFTPSLAGVFKRV